jgi:hypothetical protein
MRTTMNRIALACALASGLALGACGGGGDASASTDSSAATTVPDSAAASTAGLVSYELALTPNDRSEPLNLGALQLPTDDRAEPTPII